MPAPSKTLDQALRSFKDELRSTSTKAEASIALLEELMDCRIDGSRIGDLSITSPDATVKKVRTKANEYVHGLWDEREDAIKAINQFFSSPSLACVWTGGSDKFLDPSNCYYKNEMYVKLMKHLQDGIHPKSSIAEEFNVSERTVNDRLSELDNGVTVMGKEVRIKDRQSWRGNKYDPSIHPVMLTLNLMEVAALTVGIKQTFSKGRLSQYPFASALCEIADDVYGQLSEYGKKNVDRLCEDAGVSLNKPVSNGFRRECMEIAHFEKSGERCKVFCDGYDEPLYGTFNIGITKQDCASFTTDSGETLQLPWKGISCVEPAKDK